MVLAAIDIGQCRKVGVGVKRPEDVVVGRDGTVWMSDQRSACARVLRDGTLQRVGMAGGAPNGINMDREGRIVIANFGGPDDGYGPLQRLDPATGAVETVCGALNGRKLFGSNYPLVDSRGRIWCSHSTWGPVDRAFADLRDGLVYGVDPDGTPLYWRKVSLLRRHCARLRRTQSVRMRNHRLRRAAISDPSGRYARGADTLWSEAGARHRGGAASAPAECVPTGPVGVTDGCGFDQEGNLWVTLVMANKIVAITPSGDVVTVLSDPEGKVMRSPTNVSWGGADMRDLYIGSIASDYVVHVRSPIPGMPLAHQR